MNYKQAKVQTFKLYSSFNWPALFTRIRFFTAPYKSLVKYVPTDGTILDLGSGYGIFSNLLALMSPKRKIIAVELDKKKAFLTNKGLSNVTLITDDITKIEIPPVDCILLIHVLHHLNSYNQQEILLEACYKKLKKHGVLLIVEIDKHPFWKFILTQISDYSLYLGDIIYYRFRDDLRELLQKNKYQVQDITFDKGTPFSHVLYICKK